MGDGRFYIQGFRSPDALRGANQYCANQGKEMIAVTLTPGSETQRASLIFVCR
jgi:hypothetical protein